LCTDTGRACATAADCGPGARCFVPPGGCVRDLGNVCDAGGHANQCGEGRFCVPNGEPGKGTCHAREGACAGDTDCQAPAHCIDAGQNFQQLVSPLSTAAGAGQIFVAAGHNSELIVATAGDGDGDEVADPFDNCPRVANPDQLDSDGIGI